MKYLLTCNDCEGRGEILAGVMMNPNPYDYSDYTEAWERCPHCKGRGWRLSLRNSYWLIVWWLRGIQERRRWARYEEEVDIPF